MNAALIRLREEVRILNDNIRHINHGGEPSLALYERNDLIALMRRDVREIERAILIIVADDRLSLVMRAGCLEEAAL